ncbi:MAG: glycosyltransferase family 39 protein [Candidatus Dormibacteraeota bacterium]|nr:glycosyltransferase family 39 protein [Candidatus Dormibacteraeota bacterium]
MAGQLLGGEGQRHSRDNGQAAEISHPQLPGRQKGESGEPYTAGLITRLRRVYASPFRPVMASLLAVILGLRAQAFLDTSHGPDQVNVRAATIFYLVAVAVLIAGWVGTYRDQGFAPGEANPGWRQRLGDRWGLGRVGLVVIALVVNAQSVAMLRQDWASRPGGVMWVSSVGLLLLASLSGWGPSGLSERFRRLAHESRPRLRAGLEIAAVAGVLLLALVLRLWRLGDPAPGMHGDEGEAGTAALDILAGAHVSPFTPGLFNQANFYNWTVALFMRVFGTDLFGLRSFALFCGVLTVLFVILLARELFGFRAGLIAGLLASIQPAALLFSRQMYSNATVPLLSAMLFYFLLRGINTRRHFYFALAGVTAGSGLYYFAGGRALAPTGALFLLYMLVRHRGFLSRGWSHAAVYVIALAATASPFIAYYFIDHPAEYPGVRMIWVRENFAPLALQYHSGAWPTIVLGQLERTFSIITYARDVSAVGALDVPIATPIEAVLIVLALGWALWRSRDIRFAALSVLFWSSLIAGGVLTIDAPNLPRILGILPAMAVASAALLDHFGRLSQAALSGLFSVRSQLPGRIAAAAAIAMTVGVIGFQNWQSYFVGYLNRSQFVAPTLQGTYAQQHLANTRFYAMGVPVLYWNHGDRRFLAPAADGADNPNPSSQLPIIDNGQAANKDAVFMVWQPMANYLPVLQSFYPEGRTEVLPLSAADPDSNMTAFKVTSQQIDAHRVLRSRYVPAKGVPIEATVDTLGSSQGMPATPVAYPVSAAWDGAVVAPAYAVYSFQLGGSEGSLSIDGIDVVERGANSGVGPSEGTVVLAEGLHTVHLGAMLPDERSSVSVAWRTGGEHFQPIARRYLWDGHQGQRWLAELRRPEALPATTQQPAVKSLDDPVLIRRSDGFVGFRALQLLVPGALPFDGSWTTSIEAQQAGVYSFALRSSAGGSVKIDGVVIIDLDSSGAQQAAIPLAPGKHRVEVDYRYRSGEAFLEFSWAAPPGHPSMIEPGPSAPAAAVWSPTDVHPPPVPHVLIGADGAP